MEGVEVQPHIQLRRGQVQPVVLTMGDPKRVDEVAALCDSAEPLTFNREFKSANVVKDGQKFTVISHGIGCCSSMICFEELIKLGAKCIIRAGTCGSMKPDQVKRGDICVPFAAARDNDVCDLYIPPRMPAVATPRVFQSLLESGKQLGIPLRQGIALTNGLFYGHGKEHIENLTNWSKFTDIIDCEFQSLFLVGIGRGIETGGIATVDGSPLQWDQANYDPSGNTVAEGKKKMLTVAIHTCTKLTREYSGN
ncbi:purine nucleoside phosphorylase, putative [Eimeria tenella]|uniref:Purine nucleoside phosphorylase, putative n=1 Tax=Eimeria tenella TaxID=5802 RepID=U6L8B5_EIMTE|nr:purine nucleoside phosphorylase, putative [Eimeria tenella]CDJ44020.1 purine nucleoside phosphorylase, putative [Eimeria tenella]|eukprot:XP_013234769.1 purine nucleoside phosphorylase, putative [Eimeria tenella]